MPGKITSPVQICVTNAKPWIRRWLFSRNIVARSAESVWTTCWDGQRLCRRSCLYASTLQVMRQQLEEERKTVSVTIMNSTRPSPVKDGYQETMALFECCQHAVALFIATSLFCWNRPPWEQNATIILTLGAKVWMWNSPAVDATRLPPVTKVNLPALNSLKLAQSIPALPPQNGADFSSAPANNTTQLLRISNRQKYRAAANREVLLHAHLFWKRNGPHDRRKFFHSLPRSGKESCQKRLSSSQSNSSTSLLSGSICYCAS